MTTSQSNLTQPCLKSNICLRWAFSLRIVRTGLRFTYRTWLFVTRFIVHSVSSTRLPAVLRGRVQTLPPATRETSPTRLWAQWPFSPACPASGNYTQTDYLPVHQSSATLQTAWHKCASILTGAECIVARSCLPVAVCARSAPLRGWGVVAETNPCDVAFTTCGCTRRPRRPKAPVPISTYYTWKKHQKIVKSFFVFFDTVAWKSRIQHRLPPQLHAVGTFTDLQVSNHDSNLLNPFVWSFALWGIFG